MEFRPCIDIHNGLVKQIVGGTLQDGRNQARENFVAKQDAAFFADLYRKLGIRGGHVILLNAKDSEFYQETKKQALSALREWKGGLQAGGGITPENASEFLDAGASHVIVTSYLFEEKELSIARIEKISRDVGKEHLVLDLSCRKRGGVYRIVSDRWQNETRSRLTPSLLTELSSYCDEFLIHGVDVEGKGEGIDRELACLLGEYEGVPVTYAGGVHSYEDLRLLKEAGKDRVHVTIGSALSLFGGELELQKILEMTQTKKEPI